MPYPLNAPIMPDYNAARQNMVNGQLATNGIVLPTLVAAYRETPREVFAPAALAPFVYTDEDINIQGANRFVLEPLVEARMLQTALEGKFDSVLVLGAASLPSVEMVAAFARHIVVLEPVKTFADAAILALKRQNVTVIETSYREGYAKQAPYDCVYVTGAMVELPAIIATQLVVGGCVVWIARESLKACGRISCTYRLSEDVFETMSLADASTPYLAGFEPDKGFTF